MPTGRAASVTVHTDQAHIRSQNTYRQQVVPPDLRGRVFAACAGWSAPVNRSPRAYRVVVLCKNIGRTRGAHAAAPRGLDAYADARHQHDSGAMKDSADFASPRVTTTGLRRRVGNPPIIATALVSGTASSTHDRQAGHVGGIARLRMARRVRWRVPAAAAMAAPSRSSSGP
jgi:hypothetical protein